MKRINVLPVCIFAVIAAISVSCLSPQAARGAEKKGAKTSAATPEKSRRELTLGLTLSKDNNENTNGQYKSLLEEVIRVIADRENIVITPRYFDSDRELTDSLAKKEFDIIWVVNNITLREIVVNHGYMPFLSVSIYGKPKSKYGLFVNKSRKVSGVSDLRGLNALTYSDYYTYAALREMLGGIPPEDFFKSVKLAPDAVSSIYSLALGDTDAVFVFETVRDYMKMTNSGPLSKIRMFALSPEYTYPAVLISPRVPADIEQTLTEFFMAIHKDKGGQFKKYRQLAALTNFHFIRASRKDYEPVFKLLDESIKKGWKKDYDRWVKFQK